MDKDRRTPLRFAGVGFAVAAVWLAYQTLMHPSPWSGLNNLLSIIFFILCPPVLLTFPLMDVETGTMVTYLIWTTIALLNAALYAVIGSAWVRMRGKPAGQSTS